MTHEYIIKVDDEKRDIMGGMPLEEQPKELVRCKDCIHYGKPEYGYTKGDCRFHTAWYPIDENDYCSKAKRRTNTV